MSIIFSIFIGICAVLIAGALAMSGVHLISIYLALSITLILLLSLPTMYNILTLLIYKKDDSEEAKFRVATARSQVIRYLISIWLIIVLNFFIHVI